MKMNRLFLLLILLAVSAGANVGNLPTDSLKAAFLPSCYYNTTPGDFYGDSFPAYPNGLGGDKIWNLGVASDRIISGVYNGTAAVSSYIDFKQKMTLSNASTFSWVIKGKVMNTGIMYVSDYDDADNAVIFLYSKSGGQMQLLYYVGGTLKYGFYEIVSLGSVGDNFTIVITKNGALSSAFVNGTEISYTNPAGYRENYTLGNKTFTAPLRLNFGGGFGTGKYTAFTSYNRVLTSEEIASITASAADFNQNGTPSGTDLLLSDKTSITVNEYSQSGKAVAQALDGSGQPALTGGIATIKVTGTITGQTGDVYASVRRFSDDSVIVNWTKILTAQTGNYAGTISVPVSGLYWDKMIVRVGTNGDSARTTLKWGVGQLLWAGGQSNMGQGATVLSGRGARTARDTAGEYVGMFFYGTCTPCDYWMPCTDSTMLTGGCSMLPSLGTKLSTAWNCPVGVILGGVGGSQLIDRTDSSHSWGCFNIASNNCIYGKNLGYELTLAGAAMKTSNYKKILTAAFWQGENEGGSVANAIQWSAVAESLKTHMIADLGVSNLHVFFCQTSKSLWHYSTDSAWSTEQAAIYNTDNNCVVTYDLPQADSSHLRWDGQDSVANRMYLRMSGYFSGTPYVNPRIISATITGTHTVRVKCNKALATTSTIANDSLYRNGVAMTITGKSALNDTITYTTTDSTNGIITYRYFYGANPGGTALNATVANVLRAADGSPVLPMSAFITASSGGNGGLVGTIIGIGIGIGFAGWGFSRRKR